MQYEINSPVTKIVGKSLEITFSKLKAIFKLLIYPFFGQAVGLLICLLPVTVFKPETLSIPVLLSVTAVCLVLGLVLFCHAFWKYLLSLAALVLMAKKIIYAEDTADFNSYLDIISKRGNEYVAYLLIMALIGLLIIPVGLISFVIASAALSNKIAAIAATCIFTIIIGIIFGALFSVPLQSFVLNSGLTAFESIKKSVILVGKNYITNFGFLILVGLISFVISTVIQLPIGLVLSKYLLGSIIGENTASIVSNFVSGFISTFFLTPYGVIAATWWYLRISNYSHSPNN